VAKRLLPQFGEGRECQVVLMTINQHLDTTLDAARFLDVFSQFFLEVRLRVV
jgi:hypothetical protein